MSRVPLFWTIHKIQQIPQSDCRCGTNPFHSPYPPYRIRLEPTTRHVAPTVLEPHLLRLRMGGIHRASPAPYSPIFNQPSLLSSARNVTFTNSQRISCRARAAGLAQMLPPPNRPAHSQLDGQRRTRR